MKPADCCNGDCNQGRDCPLRADAAETRMVRIVAVFLVLTVLAATFDRWQPLLELFW